MSTTLTERPPESPAVEFGPPIESDPGLTHPLQTTVLVHGEVAVSGARKPVPYTLEVPDNLSYGGLAVLGPGYGCFKRMSRDERNAYAQAGIATMSYDPSRSTGSIYDCITAPQAVHVSTIGAVVSDASRNPGLKRAPNYGAIDFGKLLLSPHSMAGLSTTEFAEENPELVDVIIYKAAVGFGSPTIESLAKADHVAFLAEIIDSVVKKQFDPTPRNALRFLNHYFRSPIRTMGEGISCLVNHQSLEERVKVLRSEHGVLAAYMGFGLDNLVPPETIEPRADEIFDKFVILPGLSHLAPQNHPRETAEAAKQLYDALRP